MRSRTSGSLFTYLLLLTFCFLLWQLIFLFGLQSGRTLIYILTKHAINIPLALFPAQFLFASIQIGLYVLLAGVVWALTRLTAAHFALSWKQTWWLGLVLWFVTLITILLANQLIDPSSAFADLVGQFVPIPLAKILLGVCLAILSMAVFVSIVAVLKRISLYHHLLLGVIAVVLLSVGAAIFFYPASVVASKATAQPNVIIIGLDAVRPDYIGYYGHHPDNTPKLDQFFKNATNFTFSITPLARTFVAWSSILTGQYPKHTGIRFNLVEQDHLSLQYSLGNILQREGYYTIYGSDDWRFSNMSKRFGFNQLIGIHPGANDFVLGSIDDLPLSNLFVNTRVGEWLFPYSYANREAGNIYSPNAFVHLLQQKLKTAHHRPLFLAVHFCLPHFPYVWRNSPQSHDVAQQYSFAIHRLDQQFNHYLAFLKQQGLLNNAIVIVMSDHGEAFDHHGDRLITAKRYVPGRYSHTDLFQLLQGRGLHNRILDESNGHGTDILSYSQYYNVLTFRLYGKAKNRKGFVRGMVSLIDIKPTVLALLHLSDHQSDGVSLKSYVLGKKTVVPPRMIFAETGYTPQVIRKKHFGVFNAVMEGIHVFKIDPKTTHVLLRPRVAQQLLSLKERAVFYKHWILAYYPDMHRHFIPILVNAATGQWTDDLATTFAQQSPAKKLERAILRFYGGELSVA